MRQAIIGLTSLLLFSLSLGTTITLRKHLITPPIKEVKSIEELKIDGTDEHQFPEISSSSEINPGSIHPILNEKGYMVGGTSDGIWLPSEKFIHYLKGNEQYHVFSRTQILGDSQGSLPKEVDFTQGTKGYQIQLKDSRFKNNSSECFQFSIIGGWNPFPRPIHYYTAETQRYLPMVRKALCEIGLPEAKAEIKELIIADLNGDDLNEALLVASNFDLDYDHPVTTKNTIPTNPSNKYSLIILCNQINDGEEATIIFGSYQELCKFEILCIADLDGDWELELLVRATRFNLLETDSSPLIEDILVKIIDNQPKKVLKFAWSPNTEIKDSKK